MKKVKGFTLVELLVAMVIGSLLLGLGYGTMTLLRSQLEEYRSTTDKISDEIKFITLLEKEIYTADKLLKVSNNSIQLTSKEEIIYSWNNNAVVRTTALSSDTFYVAIDNTTFRFENSEVLTDATLIDELQLKCGVNGNKNEFIFSKQYSAHTFVSEEQDKQQTLWQ